MKNLFKYISLFTFIIITLASCTERIDIQLDSSQVRLSVEGHITTDSIKQWVKLSQSKDYYSSKPVTSVTGATVKLDDGEQLMTMTENPNEPGKYETASGYVGIAGRSYELNIDLAEEIGGYSHYTAMADLKPVAPIDSIEVVYNPIWEVYEVHIFALEPPSIDYYLFQVIKNGEMMTDTIAKWAITDDRFFNGNYTNGIMVGFLDANNSREKVEPGDTITLKMSAITSEFYTFISQLQDVTFEFRNPLFSGPPANVSTNIPNATGFFATYASSYASTVYTGE